jgi:hypothetical protein
MKTLAFATALICAELFLRAANSQTIPVNVDNFQRAESDRYFENVVKNGGFGKLFHYREPMPIEKQDVVRANRDTLYSAALFDLDAGPVTVTLPEIGKRFMSLIVIDEDHYVHGVYYGSGRHTFAKDKIGTRYFLAGVRLLVDPTSKDDLAAVHALQDAIKIEQPGGPGRFEPPTWDAASQKKVREAVLVLNATLPDLRRAFGSQADVDPVRHLIATAAAWGGNPDKDAIYLNISPAKNDGKTVYHLTVTDVPVDGFWSISVYGADGYFQKNDLNAYTLNNLTAKKNDDGSIAVQFGGCDGKAANCLPITPGWNYMVRLYRPRKEILDGTWKFPEAQPAQ